MLSKKLILLGAVAGLTLAGVRPGVAEGAYTVANHSSQTPGSVASTLDSAADINEDGIFALTASASEDNVSTDGETAYATSVAQATKYFDLEPGDYEAETFLRELFGTAATERLGQANVSYVLNLDCSACTWEGQSYLNLVRSVPTQDKIEYGEVVGVLAFTVNEATTVGVTVEIMAYAATGVLLSVDAGDPVPVLGANAHGGTATTELRGIVDSIVVNPVVDEEAPAEEPPAEEPPATEE